MTRNTTNHGPTAPRVKVALWVCVGCLAGMLGLAGVFYIASRHVDRKRGMVVGDGREGVQRVSE